MQFKDHLIASVICSTKTSINCDFGHEHHWQYGHERMCLVTDQLHTSTVLLFPEHMHSACGNYMENGIVSRLSHLILFIYFCSPSGASSVRCPSMCHCDIVSDGAIAIEHIDNNKRNNENEVIRNPQYRQTISSVRAGTRFQFVLCTAVLHYIENYVLFGSRACDYVSARGAWVCVSGKNGRQDKIDTSDSDAAHTDD